MAWKWRSAASKSGALSAKCVRFSTCVLRDIAGLDVEARVVADLEPADVRAAHRVGDLRDAQHTGEEIRRLVEIADEKGDVIEPVSDSHDEPQATCAVKNTPIAPS